MHHGGCSIESSKGMSQQKPNKREMSNRFQVSNMQMKF